MLRTMVLCAAVMAAASAAQGAPRVVRVRDRLWAWGNPEMARPGVPSAATYAQAGPIDRARILGAPNVVLAGDGLPDDPKAADRITREAADAREIVWEIASDDAFTSKSPAFVYTKRIAELRRQARGSHRITGLLLDDMSTGGMDRGFLPAHIRAIREALGRDARRLRTWGVVYTMSLDRPRMAEYLRELDVISLWTWHARDIPDLEHNVDRLRREHPRKPIVVGLYLHDYGEGRTMPPDLHRMQCETALRLLRAGTIEGIVFLTIDNEPATVQWTADWVRQVGDQPIAGGGSR